MSNHKGQNSILFLATLGVYLGLVLAGGAAPQVYAHAATTRMFDVRDEIELGDDFHGPPDDERSSSADSVKVYVDDVELLLISLQRLSAKSLFNSSSDFFEVRQSSYLPCVPANKEGSYSPEHFASVNDQARPFLERFSKQLTYGYSLGDCLPSRQFQDKEAVASSAAFKLDGAGLTIQVTVKKQTPQAAALIQDSLNTARSQFRTAETVALRKVIIDDTSFNIENDQVSVVTHLPRAALDDLFATNAK
jgi:hypothetical protein